jgi:hypothetical protein
MPEENFISTLLGMLSGNAQPRPDIIPPKPNEPPARPYTYLGRVGYVGKEPPKLSEMPQGDTEEGQGIFASGGIEGLKRILPQAASDLAKAAPSAALASIPAAVWKGYSPEAKAAMNVYATKYPENFARILQQPEQLTTQVLGQEAMPGANVLGQLRDLVTHSGQAQKGGQAELMLSKKALGDPTLIPHEIQHYFDIGEPFPHLPSHQEKMARSIRDVLGRENTTSLNNALDFKIPVANKIIDMTLKDKGKIFSQDTEMLHGWQNVALREARAYIAEALTKPNIKPQIKALAEQMGIAAK